MIGTSITIHSSENSIKFELKYEIVPKVLKFDFQILEIQMLCISFFKILNFDKNDNFFQILKIQKMKNAQIHFSKFEIYMAQSIHGLKSAIHLKFDK